MKAIITDLDRTLLHTDRSISPYTVQVLKQCQKQGLKVLCASARPLRTIKAYTNQVQFDAITALNGAVVSCSQQETAFGIPLETGETLCARLLELPGVSLSIETNTGLYSNEGHPEWHPVVYDGFPKLPTNITLYKILASGNEALLRREIGRILTPDVYCTISFDGLVQIMSRKATKWNGVRKMLEYFHISPKQAIAFGDDWDDIEMLEHCGLGVAVANAIPPVLAGADQVTLDNDQDGVAKMIQDNLLK